MRLLLALIASTLCLSALVYTNKHKPINFLVPPDAVGKSQSPVFYGPQKPPVIFVRPHLRINGASFGSIGYGMTFNESRQKGDRLFRKRKFADAVAMYKDAINANPDDLRAQLGLGKSYVELANFEAAIAPLSMVRHRCHRKRCELKEEAEESSGTLLESRTDLNSFRKFDIQDLNSMPDQACDALDFEARVGLEKAVLAVAKPGVPASAPADYQNDRNFKLLVASHFLAKKYHDEVKIEELSAMITLAKETTRSTNRDLVLDTIAKGTPQEQWDQLSRQTLNALTPEEKQWYLKELLYVSEKLADEDVRKAAAAHYGYVNVPMSFVTCEMQKAEKWLESQSKFDLYNANVHYNQGVNAARDCCDKTAIEEFAKAHALYKKVGSRRDIADTEYNLGIVAWTKGDDDIAKRYFKSAATAYRLDKLSDEERLASYNAAAIAVDSAKTDPMDEAFLVRFDDTFKSDESASLLALYRFKRNNYEGALEPLRRAASTYFNKTNSYDSVHTFYADSCHSKSSDPKLSNDAVIKAMFARGGRIDKYVNSRFAPSDLTERVSYSDRVSEARIRTYESLVNMLYQRSLQRTNKLDELEKFRAKLEQNRCSTLSIDRSYKNEEHYLSIVSQTLSDCWFAPQAHGQAPLTLRLQIDKNGAIGISSIDNLNVDTKFWKSAMDESLAWASPMTPPPPGLVDQDLIAIFDPVKPEVLQGSFSGPLPTICLPHNEEW